MDRRLSRATDATGCRVRWPTQIDAACRDTGFFYVTGHGVSPQLQTRVEACAASSSRCRKRRSRWSACSTAGARGGAGSRSGASSPRASPTRRKASISAKSSRPTILESAPVSRCTAPTCSRGDRTACATRCSSTCRRSPRSVTCCCAACRSRSGSTTDWFDRNLTASPTVLFRIFRYPPAGAGSARWSVGEHTDYGLLTILAQDATGGLEVRGRAGWVAAPPIPDAFVVNLGDMLERMTAGRYRSTPHRVRNTSGRDRISFPLFLDPAWDGRGATGAERGARRRPRSRGRRVPAGTA